MSKSVAMEAIEAERSDSPPNSPLTVEKLGSHLRQEREARRELEIHSDSRMTSIEEKLEILDKKMDRNFDNLVQMLSTRDLQRPGKETLHFSKPNFSQRSNQVRFSTSESSRSDRQNNSLVANGDTQREFINVPIFTGFEDDLRPWINWMENYFAQYHDFTELQKLAMSHGFIEGQALSCFFQRQSWFPFRDWNDLKREFLMQFGNKNDPEKLRFEMENRRFFKEFNKRHEDKSETNSSPISASGQLFEEKKVMEDDLIESSYVYANNSEWTQTVHQAEPIEDKKETVVELMQEKESAENDSIAQQLLPQIVELPQCQQLVIPGIMQPICDDLHRHYGADGLFHRYVEDMGGFCQKFPSVEPNHLVDQLLAKMLVRIRTIKKQSKQKKIPKSWKFRYKSKVKQSPLIEETLYEPTIIGTIKHGQIKKNAYTKSYYPWYKWRGKKLQHRNGFGAHVQSFVDASLVKLDHKQMDISTPRTIKLGNTGLVLALINHQAYEVFGLARDSRDFELSSCQTTTQTRDLVQEKLWFEESMDVSVDNIDSALMTSFTKVTWVNSEQKELESTKVPKIQIMNGDEYQLSGLKLHRVHSKRKQRKHSKNWKFKYKNKPEMKQYTITNKGKSSLRILWMGVDCLGIEYPVLEEIFQLQWPDFKSLVWHRWKSKI